MINTSSGDSTRELDACTFFHYYNSLLGTRFVVHEVLIQGSGHTWDSTFIISGCSAEWFKEFSLLSCVVGILFEEMRMFGVLLSLDCPIETGSLPQLI